MAANSAFDTPADPVVQYNEYDPDYDPRGVQAFSSDGNDGRAPIIFLDQPATNTVLPEPQILQLASSYHGMGHILNFSDQYQAQHGDFTGGLKDINTESPAVRVALEEAYENWIIQTDFDGFRIDTIKHVDYGFWNYFLPTLRQHLAAQGKKNFYVFGESFDGDDVLDGSYTMAPINGPTNAGPFDGIVYFPQLFDVYDGVFANATLGPSTPQSPTTVIQQLWAQRYTDYSTKAQTGGITNAAGVGIPSTEALVNFIDNHDVGRFLFSSNGDKAGLRNALVLNMTAMGVPCIYYGTEQDFNGGNDPANREVLWAPLGPGYVTTGVTFAHIQTLLGIRKTYVALRQGLTNVVFATDDIGTEADAGLFAFERTGGDAGTAYALVVLATNASHTSSAAMTVSQPAGTILIDVLNGNTPYTVGAGGMITLSPPLLTWEDLPAKTTESAMILVPQTQLVKAP
jgi:glycosidase